MILTDFFTVYFVCQQVDGGDSLCFDILADGGQLRDTVVTERQIVKTRVGRGYPPEMGICLRLLQRKVLL